MNRALQIALKQTLWAKIKRLGVLWREDTIFIADYGKWIFEANLDDLEGAIACFSELVTQAEKLGKRLYYG